MIADTFCRAPERVQKVSRQKGKAGTVHAVTDVVFAKKKMTLRIDGQKHAFDLALISPSLAGATQKERELLEVTPSGYGIRWPLIGLDLSIDGLFGSHFGPQEGERLPRIRRGSPSKPEKS